MNPLKRIYCNQYHELKAKGKADEALAYGTKLASIALVLWGMGLFFGLMAFWPDFKDAFDDLARDLFGRRSGRTIGKAIALLFFCGSFVLVRITLGRRASYERTIETYENLAEADRQRISRSGLIIFISSTGIFIVGIASFLIMA